MAVLPRRDGSGRPTVGQHSGAAEAGIAVLWTSDAPR